MGTPLSLIYLSSYISSYPNRMVFLVGLFSNVLSLSCSITSLAGPRLVQSHFCAASTWLKLRCARHQEQGSFWKSVVTMEQFDRCETSKNRQGTDEGEMPFITAHHEVWSKGKAFTADKNPLEATFWGNRLATYYQSIQCLSKLSS